MRISFLINPIAGMGGRVGLKGTDGVVAEARARGAEPVAPGRAAAALAALRDALARERLEPPAWLTCAGAMGEDVLRAAGFTDLRICHTPASPCTAADTRAAAEAFVAAGAELILFCGGDGTARDLAAVAGTETPILGIPAGVKMYSGAFGVSPARTADIVAAYIAGRLSLATVDIVDLDEDRYRAGEWQTRLHGAALSPYEPSYTQAAKALIAEASDAEVKSAIAAFLAEEFARRPTVLVILGPGSTAQAVAADLGVQKPPLTVDALAVDALAGGALVGRDLSERGLLALLDRYEDAELVLSPIGAQGFVLGRGNLQISPAVLRRIGLSHLTVVATPAKLRRTPALRFDTGDPALDRALAGRGYLSVVTGYRRRRLVPVAV